MDESSSESESQRVLRFEVILGSLDGSIPTGEEVSVWFKDTKLKNGRVFHTDSNGLEMVQRVLKNQSLSTWENNGLSYKDVI